MRPGRLAEGLTVTVTINRPLYYFDKFVFVFDSYNTILKLSIFVFRKNHNRAISRLYLCGKSADVPHIDRGFRAFGEKQIKSTQSNNKNTKSVCERERDNLGIYTRARYTNAANEFFIIY